MKCVANYAAAWPKLQKKATGTNATCDATRLVANNDGTVTDNLTGLQLYGAPELCAPREFPVRPS